MKCPRCGQPASRDSADVGVGVIYGPYGCPCGWSESPDYDLTAGPKERNGYHLDQWGGATPEARPTLAAALAEVCGYHEGDNCTHCAETLDRHRERGWTDAQILADVALYRADFDAWADRVRERATTCLGRDMDCGRGAAVP